MNSIAKVLRLGRNRRTVAIAIARAFAAGVAALSMSAAAVAAGEPAKVNVVAAENFYGDIAKQIGGNHVDVTSILSNPDQDPHLFEASPKTARALQHAAIVVYNGAAYDPWMDKLLAASKGGKRTTIVAAELVGRKSGDNPHLWYDPKTMPVVASKIAAALVTADPGNQADYERNLASVIAALKPIDDKVAQLRERYRGTPVTATEPVFDYMANTIGFDMHNVRFQLAAMNDTEPSASDIATFERDLSERKVRVLIYNSQATEALTKRMLQLAQRSRVPTVSVTETQPAGKTFEQWMLAQLAALEAALSAKQP